MSVVKLFCLTPETSNLGAVEAATFEGLVKLALQGPLPIGLRCQGQGQHLVLPAANETEA